MIIGQQQEGVKGRENDKKKLVIAANREKGKGIGRRYARVVNKAGKKDFKPFFEDHLSKNTRIRTGGWSTCKPFKKQYPDLKQEKSGKKGENFNDRHRVIMMFKGWMRGIQHSVDHVQDYPDQYTYRFNRVVTWMGLYLTIC